MKNAQRLILMTVLLAATSIRSFALIVPSSSVEPPKKENISVSTLSTLTVKDFLALTPRKIREVTGEKMTLSQRVALKLAQIRLKKEIRANPDAKMSTTGELVNSLDFNLGGFVLGLLLPVIGVLIAYLIGDRDVIKWAWVGFAIFFVVFLLFLVI